MSAEGLVLLTEASTFKHKVSSVLNRSQEFAGKNMFDGDVNTCWNSEQGSPQYIFIDFTRIITPVLVKIIFQGGFAGQDGIIEIGNEMSQLTTIHHLDNIQDSNTCQTFQFNSPNEDIRHSGRYLKLTFPSSTDFYGRVTIYNLEIYGVDAN